MNEETKKIFAVIDERNKIFGSLLYSWINAIATAKIIVNKIERDSGDPETAWTRTVKEKLRVDGDSEVIDAFEDIGGKDVLKNIRVEHEHAVGCLRKGLESRHALVHKVSEEQAQRVRVGRESRVASAIKKMREEIVKTGQCDQSKKSSLDFAIGNVQQETEIIRRYEKDIVKAEYAVNICCSCCFLPSSLFPLSQE